MNNDAAKQPPRFPCAICGAEIVPATENRCEKCLRFACRDCLKIHYHTDPAGHTSPTSTLCYDCYHSIHKKPYL